MKNYKYLYVLLIIMLYSCESDIFIPEEKVPKILKLIPSTPYKVGENLNLVLDKGDLEGESFHLHISIEDYWYDWQLAGFDTFKTYIPFLPSEKTEFELKMHFYKNNSLSEKIEIIPENEAFYESIQVKFSDLERFEYKDVEKWLRKHESIKSWQAKKDQDTITLLHIRPNHDESSLHSTFKFLDQGENKLPVFIEGTRIEKGMFVRVNDTLKSGIIKIQEWNPVGIISGIIFPSVIENEEQMRHFAPSRIMFWHDFSTDL